MIHFPEGKREISDYWEEQDTGLPIMVLEAQALLSVLRTLGDRIQGHRIDANIDSMVLLNAWMNQGSHSRELNLVLKDIFDFVLGHDLVLNLGFVKSKNNIAHGPSCLLRKSDASLSPCMWETIQFVFGGSGGLTIDLMALDSNSMKDRHGRPLRHFTPYSTPGSSGVNLFTQEIPFEENCYVFPPFHLVLPVVNFLIENRATCTVLVPATGITPVWLPAVYDYLHDAMIIGRAGDKGILLYPSKKGFTPDKFGLKWNFWAIRISVSTQNVTYGKLLFSREPHLQAGSEIVCCGDSMIRFLESRHFLKSPMARVRSLGGLFCQVSAAVFQELRRITPRFILVHAAVNNLSKMHLFKSEYQQISLTISEIDQLAVSLQKHSKLNLGVTVILSSVTATRDDFINTRARIINDHIESCCTERGWLYMDNSNISRHYLRDTDHLNETGEDILEQNIARLVERALK